MWEKQKSSPEKEDAKTEKKYKHLTVEETSGTTCSNRTLQQEDG